MSEKEYTIQSDEDGSKFKSMLDAMGGLRIFSVKKSDGLFRVQESCDHYYAAHLTKEQLYDLGVEIINLSKS